MADGEPGLARAGRPFGEDQFVTLQGAKIAVLRGVARAHRPAPACGDLVEARLVAGRLGSAGRKQHALQHALLDRAVDIAGCDRLAAFHAVVEDLKHVAGALAGVGCPLEGNLIAERVRDDAQAALDLGEMLIVLAEHGRGVAVVGKTHGDVAGVRPGQAAAAHGDGRAADPGGRPHADCLSATRAGISTADPNSELTPRALTVTGTIEPIAPSGPSSWIC